MSTNLHPPAYRFRPAFSRRESSTGPGRVCLDPTPHRESLSALHREIRACPQLQTPGAMRALPTRTSTLTTWAHFRVATRRALHCVPVRATALLDGRCGVVSQDESWGHVLRGSRTPSIDETDAESPNDGEHGSAAIPARRAANMAAGAPAGGCGAPTKSKTPPNKAGLRLWAPVWDAAVSVRVCLRACVRALV